MFGQWNHFASYAVEKIPYAIDRYTNEVTRLHRVLEHRLEEAHCGSPAKNTAWPTSSPSRGSAGPSGATSTSPTTPRPSAGTTKWRRGPRCSAVSPYWPTGRGRCSSPNAQRENYFGKTQFAAR
jgi:GST-like protein